MTTADSRPDPADQPPARTGTDEKRAPDGLTVVGIGASAGGLAPLRTFFAALPSDTGMTFVVIVHLSPEHESMLPELLRSYTSMSVTQVQARTPMQPNHVYVIPPAKRLVVTEGCLDLENLDQPPGRRLQIDTFFRTLAEQHGDGAAVILSGTGSDGAVGMRAVKEQGGLLLVQAPEEAEYDGMPKSAIATSLVDVIAPVAELAAQLVAAKRTKETLELPAEPQDLAQREQQTLTQILAQLRLRTGHDFGGYKEATLLRRIARRMELLQLNKLADYLLRLRQDGEEVDALYRDVLIHVTEFFRDAEAWSVLAKEVVPQLFTGKSAGDAVRVWTVGCATGEEAYSAAMLLLEHAAQLDRPPHIQIFASDLGRLALDFARKGVYPEAIAADVPETRLARFFVHENSHYQVRSEVRELVLFAPHNLLQDPPFSKLDLVICRNVLIYLQRPVQEHVFEAFHYALRQTGYLFLGSAESTEGVTELFDTVDKRHRLYRRSEVYDRRLLLPALPILPHGHHPLQVETTAAAPGAEEQHRLLLEEVGLPGLLVDEQQRVLHFSESAWRYLAHPAGPPTEDLLRLVRPELQSELRLALHRAFSGRLNAQTPPVAVQFNGEQHPVTVFVRPSPRHGQALVLFWEDSGAAEPDATGTGAETGAEAGQNGGRRGRQAGRAEAFEAQLLHSEQQLQSTREEYESSVEELRAANEELQSTNEEYRSTLEELETSKEELQSINEELQSVNQELKVRMEAIATANSDLQNLFAATEIATLFLDRELCVKRYTPRAAELFNLVPSDHGRPIWHLRSKLDYPTLEPDVRRVLANLIPVEHQVQAEDGRWFLVGVRPYRTVEDKIDGVVITCVDISSNKANEEALRTANQQLHRSQERLRLTLASITDYAFITLDTAGTIVDWQAGAEQMFGYTRAEVLGQPCAILFTPEDRAAGMPGKEIEQARSTGRAADERWHLRKDGTRFYVSGVMAPLDDGEIIGYVKVARDLTESRQAGEALEREVQSRTAQVRALVTQLTISEQEERRRISAILHDDLQQQIFSVNVQLALMRAMLDANETDAARRVIDEIDEALRESVQVMRSLSVSLSPPILHDEGLYEAVGWLASLMRQQYRLAVAVKAEQPLPQLDEDLRVLLFETIRELLFNVAKHAGVAEAAVTLAVEEGQLRIEVSDAGSSFDPAAQAPEASSQGLLRAQRRLQLLGGRVEVQARPGEGTRVTILVPQPSS
jgi:two-component system CheB/CheR fusion protein